MKEVNSGNGRARHQRIGLWLGPAAAILMLIAGPPDALTDAAWRTAAMGTLMAVWWATEAVPIAVTALLPLVLFPLLGIASIQNTAARIVTRTKREAHITPILQELHWLPIECRINFKILVLTHK